MLFTCGKCRFDLPRESFYWRGSGKRITECKSCYGRTNSDAKLKYTFNMTREEYIEILESQGGGCAICGTYEPGGRGAFHVDHDHGCCSGKKSCGECVRGLLCTQCNVLLAMANDSEWRLTSAISYLRENSSGG